MTALVRFYRPRLQRPDPILTEFQIGAARLLSARLAIEFPVVWLPSKKKMRP